MLSADDNRLLLTFNGETRQIGQVIINRPAKIRHVPDNIPNIEIMSKETFNELPPGELKELSKTIPLYTLKYYPRINGMTPVDFDFIQVEGCGIIYAKNGKVIDLLDRTEECCYLMIKHGIIPDSECLKKGFRMLEPGEWSSNTFVREMAVLLRFYDYDEFDFSRTIIEDDPIAFHIRNRTVYYSHGVLSDNLESVKKLLEIGVNAVVINNFARMIEPKNRDVLIQITPVSRKGRLVFYLTGTNIIVSESLSIGNGVVKNRRGAVFVPDRKLEVISREVEGNSVRSKVIVEGVGECTYVEELESIELTDTINFDGKIDISKLRFENGFMNRFRMHEGIAYSKIKDKLFVIGRGEIPEKFYVMDDEHVIGRAGQRVKVFEVVNINNLSEIYSKYNIRLVMERNSKVMTKSEFEFFTTVLIAKIITGINEKFEFRLNGVFDLKVNDMVFKFNKQTLENVTAFINGDNVFIVIGSNDDTGIENVVNFFSDVDGVIVIINAEKFRGIAIGHSECKECTEIIAKEPMIKSSVLIGEYSILVPQRLCGFSKCIVFPLQKTLTSFLGGGGNGS